MTSSVCSACKSTHTGVCLHVRDYITGEYFAVQRCQSCGLGFTPPPDNIERFYPTFYRRYSPLALALLRALYNWRVKRYVCRFGYTGTALEVGCGSGWMLSALRQHGYQVVGNERTFQGAAFAKSVLDFPIFVGSLEALRPGSHFDMIILFQVLEHLGDPLATLRQCARLLKPGGRVVIAVPNLESWQARLTGPAWFHLDVPRHLFHFSPRSLSRVLDLADLTISSTCFVSWEHDPYGWLQSFLNCLGFEQNLLTRWIMGVDRRTLATPVGIGMAICALLLLVPSLLVAMVSWWAQAGAVMEVYATKKVSRLPEGGRECP